MSYKFIKIKDPENKFDLSDVEVTVHKSDVTLTELLEEFREFLMASGFNISASERLQLENEDVDSN